MKRMFTLCLAAVLALSLTACGKETPPADSGSASGSAGTSAGTPDISEPDASQPDVSVPDASQPDVSVPVEDHNAPAVLAEYPPENAPEDLIIFREEPTDYDQPVLFRAQTDVRGFSFFTVDYPADGGEGTEGEALFTCDELKKGEKIILVTSFPGDMPSRGISFDLGGQHEAYALSMSGEDGSLMLNPMGGVIPGW